MLISTPHPSLPPIAFPPPVTGAAQSKQILVLVCLPKMRALQPNVTQDLVEDQWSLRYYYNLSLRLNSNKNLPVIFYCLFSGPPQGKNIHINPHFRPPPGGRGMPEGS